MWMMIAVFFVVLVLATSGKSPSKSTHDTWVLPHSCPTPDRHRSPVGATWKCSCGIVYELVREHLTWWKPLNTNMRNGIAVPLHERDNGNAED